jgi:hypothetical protein
MENDPVAMLKAMRDQLVASRRESAAALAASRAAVESSLKLLDEPWLATDLSARRTLNEGVVATAPQEPVA